MTHLPRLLLLVAASLLAAACDSGGSASTSASASASTAKAAPAAPTVQGNPKIASLTKESLRAAILAVGSNANIMEEKDEKGVVTMKVNQGSYNSLVTFARMDSPASAAAMENGPNPSDDHRSIYSGGSNVLIIQCLYKGDPGGTREPCSGSGGGAHAGFILEKL